MTETHLLLAQANSLHLPLRDKSLHLICTSPPYFGLRDYHTATWVGGAVDCDHKPSSTPTTRGLASSTLGGGKQTTGHQHEGYGAVCRRCGAVRHDAQLGNEALHDCHGAFTGTSCGACYICHLRAVAKELWRVLRDDGTFWLIIGDGYNAAGRVGHGTRIGAKQGTNRASATGDDHCRASAPGLKPKDLLGTPWRLALALQADGWYLRSDIVWHKLNPMPNSMKDRCTSAHEYIFLFSKRERYFYDALAVAEPAVATTNRGGFHKGQSLVTGPGAKDDGFGTRWAPSGTRNLRDVWPLVAEQFPGAHYATFPTEIPRRAILAGTSAYGVCSLCGAPWRRLVERQRVLDGHIPVTGTFCKPEDPFRIPANGKGHWRYSTVTTEHGWAPSCPCAAAPVPATVLDPFCGSATTLQVARELGRHGIGLDLSWTYLTQEARARLALDAPQQALFHPPPVAPPQPAQPALW